MEGRKVAPTRSPEDVFLHVLMGVAGVLFVEILEFLRWGT